MKRPPEYDGLMERMARQLGLEVLRDRVTLGLSPTDVTRLMHRCAACSEADDCRRRLAQHKGQDMPPAFCPNRKALLYLSTRLGPAGKAWLARVSTRNPRAVSVVSDGKRGQACG